MTSAYKTNFINQPISRHQVKANQQLSTSSKAQKKTEPKPITLNPKTRVQPKQSGGHQNHSHTIISSQSANNTKSSQVSRTSKDNHQSGSVPTDINKTSVWRPVFDRTFLSLYKLKSEGQDKQDGYDFAFQIGSSIVYVLVESRTLLLKSLQLPKSHLNDVKQKMAMQLLARQQRLKTKTALSSGDDLVSDKTADAIYFIGLTQINAVHDQKTYLVEHDYGSQFFFEDCVLDLDDERQILQMFSVSAFTNIIEIMQTPSDLLAFLQHHVHAFSEAFNEPDYAQIFSNELVLARQFLLNPAFYERAIAVQNKLVDIGLLAHIENRLQDTQVIASTDASTQARQTMVTSMQQKAQMFHRLINGTVKRQHAQAQTLSVELVQILVSESMYTRMSIMEEVMAYNNQDMSLKNLGYLRHQHSYEVFGRHYVLVFYGTDTKATYRRANMADVSADILLDINSQLQDPVMTEYVLLGFDMSRQDAKGTVSVQMDVFYQKGAKMTEIEKRLYARLQALTQQ